MTIFILTLFPEMFDGPFQHSIVKIAQQNDLVDIRLVNIRDFGIGKHKIVDDKPYGGGTGMILRIDVLDKALKSVDAQIPKEASKKTVLMDARGKTLTQGIVTDMSKLDVLVLVAGHYEGFDERVVSLVDESISIGDYVLTGGEIPAMVITDAVVRWIPGVLKEGVTERESFSSGNSLLEHPHYTRPRVYKDMQVPEILLAGDHAKTTNWKLDQATKKTKKVRPDLLKKTS